jgi:hypothetical protein
MPYSFRCWIKDGKIVRSFVRATVTENTLGPNLAEVQERIDGIMEELFRDVRKQSDQTVEDLQRRAAEQRKMVEDLERRSRESSDRR